MITTDEKNKAIDSSNGIASPPSLKVTGFAQFSMVSLNRNSAGDDTVGAKSILDFIVKVGLPMDAGCKLKITFPSDMPLDGDSMKSVVSSDFTNSNNVPFEIKANTVILTGCPANVDQSASYLFILSDVINKGWV